MYTGMAFRQAALPGLCQKQNISYLLTITWNRQFQIRRTSPST